MTDWLLTWLMKKSGKSRNLKCSFKEPSQNWKTIAYAFISVYFSKLLLIFYFWHLLYCRHQCQLRSILVVSTSLTDTNIPDTSTSSRSIFFTSISNKSWSTPYSTTPSPSTLSTYIPNLSIYDISIPDTRISSNTYSLNIYIRFCQ